MITAAVKSGRNHSFLTGVRLAPCASSAPVLAQPPAPDQPTLEIYGFAQADAIVDFEQNNPDWYDVLRPSRLPSFPHEFGSDGHFYLSPRQSRFGVKSNLPTADGDLKAQFEIDMTTPALEAVKRAIAKGVVVVRSTRVGDGIVRRNIEVDDDNVGTVASKELNPSKSRVLLKLALTQSPDARKVQEAFDQF